MAAFTEAERVNIRMYLGYSATFLQADPRLESAITAIQAIADGGTRPDDSTTTLVRTILTSLASYDTAIDGLNTQKGALALDQGQGGLQLDSARETARLAQAARRYVHRLSKILDTNPRADVFSASLDYGKGYAGNPLNSRTAY